VDLLRRPNMLLVGLLAACVAAAGLAAAGFDFWAENRVATCQVLGIEGPMVCARNDMLVRMRMADFVVLHRDVAATLAALAIVATLAAIVRTAGRTTGTCESETPRCGHPTQWGRRRSSAGTMDEISVGVPVAIRNGRAERLQVDMDEGGPWPQVHRTSCSASVAPSGLDSWAP
jgi:hypothetical protein